MKPHLPSPRSAGLAAAAVRRPWHDHFVTLILIWSIFAVAYNRHYSA